MLNNVLLFCFLFFFQTILLKGVILAVGLWLTGIRYQSFLYAVGLHLPLLFNAFAGFVTDSTKFYSVSYKQSGANKSGQFGVDNEKAN